MKFTSGFTTLLMVRPAAFGYNTETAASNAFQMTGPHTHQAVSSAALAEFDAMTELLSSHDIDIKVYDDDPHLSLPDAVFPNNWITFHDDGKVIVYPMMAESRRKERRPLIIRDLADHFRITEVVDLSHEENEGRFLEGTGSLVFDYRNKLVYACKSPRTHPELVKKVAGTLGYRSIIFDAVDDQLLPVYHTNVVMNIGTKTAVICLDAIKNEEQQEILLESFSSTGHKVIAISYDQMKAFAGNMLEVLNKHGEPVVLMSQTTFQSLLPGQINAISAYADILPVKIPTIEKCGGGSVRCMVADIRLPVK
jgi:hypothetical protein